MKRRKALQRLGFGLSAGFMLPQLVASCKKEDPGPQVPYDGVVAIVGAGVAGLAAADILNSKGIKTVIVEASNFLGGRMRSFKQSLAASDSFILPPGFDQAIEVSIADFPLELGAEVVYGSDSTMAKIIQNLNVPTVDISVGTNQYILDHQVKSADAWAGDSDFEAVQQFMNTLPSYTGPAASITATAGVSARAQNLLNAQGANAFGSSADLVGAIGVGQVLGAKTHDKKSLVLKSNLLQDLILSRFSVVTGTVQLNTQIKSISYSPGKVELTDGTGKKIEATKVIVTVPLSILKNGTITFSPALPGTFTSSLANIGMDASLRVFLDFKKNFWGADSGMIWGGETAPQYFNTGLGRSQFYDTLSITINGPKAAQLSALGAGMIDVILAELDSIYGVPSPGLTNPATLYIRRNPNDPNQDNPGPLYIIQDWTKEVFIQGGYSYPLAGTTIDDHKNIGAPVNNTVFFAGEATDVNGDAGTINGALASAERAVTEVIKSIQNP